MSQQSGKVDGRNSRSEATRKRILDTAASCYQRYGIGNTQVDDILKECGLARATLYRHFQSMDDLVIAVLQRDQGDIVDYLQALFKKRNNCVEYLTEALTYLIYDCRSRPMTTLLFVEQSAGVLNREKIWTALNNQVNIHIMDDLYREASDEGVLRRFLNKDMLTEWIWRFITSYLSNPGKHMSSRESTQAFVRQIFIPSVFDV